MGGAASTEWTAERITRAFKRIRETREVNYLDKYLRQFDGLHESDLKTKAEFAFHACREPTFHGTFDRHYHASTFNWTTRAIRVAIGILRIEVLIASSMHWYLATVKDSLRNELVDRYANRIRFIRKHYVASYDHIAMKMHTGDVFSDYMSVLNNAVCAMLSSDDMLELFGADVVSGCRITSGQIAYLKERVSRPYNYGGAHKYKSLPSDYPRSSLAIYSVVPAREADSILERATEAAVDVIYVHVRLSPDIQDPQLMLEFSQVILGAPELQNSGRMKEIANECLEIWNTKNATHLAEAAIAVADNSAARASEADNGGPAGVPTCAVCMEPLTLVIYLPCRHQYCCAGCDADLARRKCPGCNAKIRETIVPFTNLS
jgi:Zinc finger, C3HC4 type (RING finger)